MHAASTSRQAPGAAAAARTIRSVGRQADRRAVEAGHARCSHDDSSYVAVAGGRNTPVQVEVEAVLRHYAEDMSPSVIKTVRKYKHSRMRLELRVAFSLSAARVGF